MKLYTQDTRVLEFLTFPPLEKDLLLIQRFSGNEEISRPFAFKLLPQFDFFLFVITFLIIRLLHLRRGNSSRQLWRRHGDYLGSGFL